MGGIYRKHLKEGLLEESNQRHTHSDTTAKEKMLSQLRCGDIKPPGVQAVFLSLQTRPLFLNHVGFELLLFIRTEAQAGK